MNREAEMAMQRADAASVVRGHMEPIVNDLVFGAIHLLVANYRGATLTHDVMVGKIGEISALMGLLSHLDGAMRAGEVVREKELGNGTKAQQPASPGSRSRPRP
jgi:hypothetical protein